MALAGCAAQPLNATKSKQTPATPPAAAAPAAINVPIEYYKLDNGLKVVLSRDTTAPTATVGVYYHIGFRIEPRDRTGFAHLFEHLMFQGSGNLGKMAFIQLIEGNGGVLNGSTRFDFTNYYEIVPANVLETVLWAEADRMKALAITQANLANQQGVVKNEVRVQRAEPAVRRLPLARRCRRLANQNWYNAHNFYGDLEDLDAATLADAQAFFDTYYAPNNAVLVVVGDFDPGRDAGLDREVLRADPAARPAAASRPHRAVRTAEKRDSYVDRLAPRPGARARLAGAAAQHARALRVQPARHDPAAGRGQPPVAEAGAGARLFGRGRGRHQPARQRVHLRRPDAVDALPDPRPRAPRRMRSSPTSTPRSRASRPSRRRRRSSTAR